jgi:hypothetical protein
MKLRTFMLGALVAGSCGRECRLLCMLRITLEWAITMRITGGTQTPGGTSIIRIGWRSIIRNGLKTAIGMRSIIIGMIASGGKPTTPNGRMIITPIGSSI